MDRLEIYDVVSRAVLRRRKESLVSAAQRYLRRRPAGYARPIAERVVACRDQRNDAAWSALRAAAELWKDMQRPRLVT